MKKRLILLLLLTSPAWGQDDELPRFPKIAPPDPLPEPACASVANPRQWGLGEWTNPVLRLHIAESGWTIGGRTQLSGDKIQLDDCTVSLNEVFSGIRTEDGRMYGILRTANGKAERITLSRP